MIELKEAYKIVLSNYDDNFNVVECYETDTNYYFVFVPKNADIIDDGIVDGVNKETGELSEMDSPSFYCLVLSETSYKDIDLKKLVESKDKIMMNNIQRIRKEKGIKQLDFAKMLGMTRPGLSYVENGNAKFIAEDKLQKMCEILDVSKIKLLGLGNIKYIPETEEDIDYMISLLEELKGGK